MARSKRPLSTSAIKREFEKGRAKLNATRKKKKSRAEKEVINLQIKLLNECETLLNHFLLI